MMPNLNRPSIEWTGLTKSFGGYKLWEPFDGSLEYGSSTVVLGPSGVGKTTFLRILAGLEQEHQGNVLIHDCDVTQIPPRDRNIAFLFQKPVLYPFMTVRDNIAFPLRLQGYCDSAIDSKVRRLGDLLDIAKLLGRSPSTLSGGEWQRAALGRCFAREAAVRLLDEPVKAALAPNQRARLRKVLRQLHREFGGTTLMVTHDQDEGLELGDSALVMLPGTKPLLQPIISAYKSPINREVALFLGGGVPVQAFYDSRQQCLKTEDGLILPLTKPEVGPRKEGFEWIVRPEAVRLTQGDIFEITETIFQGASYRVTLTKNECTLEAIDDQPWRAGQRVGVELENDLVPCYDRHGKILTASEIFKQP